MTNDHIPTLMTVHAHPDDETIGTGGTMAKAVAAGRRVVLVTARGARWARSSSRTWTRPRTIAGWASSGRASSSGRWARSAVTEWENLGYHDSDMMGRAGNPDPRSLLAGRPR